MRLFFVRLIFLTVLLFVLSEKTKSEGVDNLLLNTALEAHNSQIKKITSLHGKMTVRSFDNKNLGFPTSEFWITENHYHFKSFSEGIFTETEKIKNKIKILTTRQNLDLPENRLGVITEKNMVCVGNPWDYNLFSFIGPKNHRDTLDELVNNPEVTSTARMEKSKSGPFVVFNINHSKGKMTISLSPEHNYLAKKVHGVFNYPKPNTLADFTITEFTEAKPGIFLPVECVCTIQANNETKGWSAKFKYFQINTPLSNADLTLTFPENVMVTDETTKQVLRTNNHGVPSRPVLSKNGHPLVYTDLKESPGSKVFGNSASKDEPHGMNWLYLIALGVGFLAVAWAVTVKTSGPIKQ